MHYPMEKCTLKSVNNGKESTVNRALGYKLVRSSLCKKISCYEKQQLILGTGTAIWWVTEPHCLNTNIYSYLETSGGQSSNLYLNVVHFFNTSVN